MQKGWVFSRESPDLMLEFPTLENLRYCAPCEWGKLLGLRAWGAMEQKTGLRILFICRIM